MLHLRSVVLRQEAVTRAEIIHLQGELVITRTLKITTIIITITTINNNNITFDQSSLRLDSVTSATEGGRGWLGAEPCVV